MPLPRTLGHTPPGDWTLTFRRDASGRVAVAQVSSWLARNPAYDRID